jgi:metal-sulfur cluster biosynthetic enzyme
MTSQDKEILKDRVIQVLKTISDPELPLNIWDMGLIYKIDIDDNGFVLIVMTLTAPNCPVAEDLAFASRTSSEKD